MARQKTKKLGVTLVSTIFNESRTITTFIESIFSMARAPDEVIIVDGGSTDNTAELVKSKIDEGLPIKFFVAPGNRSVGRNLGVDRAEHDVIAITDAGCKLESSWLANLVRPFEEDEGLDVVAGFYRYEGETPMQRAIGIVSTRDLSRIEPTEFLASTRSIAFRRRAFDKVGGFDERYWHNEDTPFNLSLKAAGARYYFASDAIVIWLPPKRLKTHFYKYYRFGRGDGEAKIFAFPYATLYGQYIFYLMIALIGGSILAPCLGLAGAVGAFLIFQYRKFLPRLPDGPTTLRLPAAVLARDFGNMCGYLVGRLRPFTASG